jgi:ribosomal protein L40E
MFLPKYCPSCGAEYQHTASECAECNVALVLEPPKAVLPSKPGNEELPAARDLALCSTGTADQVEEMAEILQLAGISSRVDSHPPGEPFSAGPRQKLGFQTSRLGLYVLGLYVRPEDLEEARQILEQGMAEKLEASPARVGEEFEACPGCGARIPQDAESCLECGLEFPLGPD